MNMGSLAVILGGITALTLGACTVVTSTGSTGTGGTTSATGAGGSASTTGTGNGGSGGAGGATTTTSSTTTTSTTTTTGTGMCDPTYTCVEAISQTSGDPALLCDGPARMNFDALAACTCSGACAASCMDNACMQLEPSAECKACLVTPTTGCKTEYDACVGS